MRKMRAFPAYLTVAISVCVCGCRTAVHESPGPSSYLATDVELSISLNRQDRVFDLKLSNLSDEVIRDCFPARLFEGAIWVVREGQPVVKLYDWRYMNLLLHATWGGGLVELHPGFPLVYTIPIDELAAEPGHQTEVIELQGALVFSQLERGFLLPIRSEPIRIDNAVRVRVLPAFPLLDIKLQTAEDSQQSPAGDVPRSAPQE